MDSFHLFTILIILYFSFASLTKARNVLFQEEEGITLHLIHRDSPISPLYDPSRTRFDLITDALERSKYRVSSMMKTSSSHDIQFQLNRIPGEYIMELSIGNPPFKIQGIVDTYSDFTWTPCTPCTSCNQTTPIFNPKNSKSYKTLSCNTTHNCMNFDFAYSSCTKESKCVYKSTFFCSDSDNCLSEGDLSSDTFTIDSSRSNKSISIKNFVFGCGHNNTGAINGTVWGTFSLSNGPMSIINQLEQKKFSYCLVPSFTKSNITSKINFGSRAIVAGPGTVTTPLRRSDTPSYVVSLEAIKVNNKIISYEPFAEWLGISIEKGDALIDTGSTMTYVPHEFYHGYLKEEVMAAIAAEPSQEYCPLCYKKTPDLKLPTITLSFTGGDVVLPPSSTFIEAYEGIICFTFHSFDDYDIKQIVFGNLVQQNFLVGYDLVKQEVSFKPTDCTKQ